MVKNLKKPDPICARRPHITLLLTCMYFLKMLREVEFLTDIGYSKTNNKYLKSYDPKQKSKHVIYTDTNNLYGYAMYKFLPTSGSKWTEPKDFGN